MMECSFHRFCSKCCKMKADAFWVSSGYMTTPDNIFENTWQKAECTTKTWETVTLVVCRVFFVDSEQFGMADADIDRQLLWFESLTRTHAFVFQVFFLVELLKQCYEGRLRWSNMVFIWARTHQKVVACKSWPTSPQPIFQMVQKDKHGDVNTETRSKALQIRTIQSDYTSKTSWLNIPTVSLSRTYNTLRRLHHGMYYRGHRACMTT